MSLLNDEALSFEWTCEKRAFAAGWFGACLYILFLHHRQEDQSESKTNAWRQADQWSYLSLASSPSQSCWSIEYTRTALQRRSALQSEHQVSCEESSLDKDLLFLSIRFQCGLCRRYQSNVDEFIKHITEKHRMDVRADRERSIALAKLSAEI